MHRIENKAGIVPDGLCYCEAAGHGEERAGSAHYPESREAVWLRLMFRMSFHQYHVGSKKRIQPVLPGCRLAGLGIIACFVKSRLSKSLYSLCNRELQLLKVPIYDINRTL
jgi:hypothetical protein